MKSEPRVERSAPPFPFSDAGLKERAFTVDAPQDAELHRPFERTEDLTSVYIRCPEIPPANELIDLALSRPPDVEKSLRLVTYSEIPILQRFAPLERTWPDEIAKSEASTAATPASLTIARLGQMAQLLGPFDHTLFNTGGSVNEEWIESREDKFLSIRQKISPELIFTVDTSSPVFERALRLKAAALELLMKLPLPEHQLVSTSAKTNSDTRFGYVNAIRDRLGDNLTSVLAYGSSITAPVGARLNDYDNILVVEDVQSAMRSLQHFKLTWQDVPVHFSAVPKAAVGHFLLMNYAPGTSQQSYRVIDGSIDIPHVEAPLLAEMGIHSAVSLCMSRRTSLLSKFIDEADVFITRAHGGSHGMGFIEAYSVIPLTKIGWLIQFINDPEQERLPKREAADRLVKLYDLPPINPVLKDAKLLAAAKKDEVQQALAESIRTMHFALARFVNELGGANS